MKCVRDDDMRELQDTDEFRRFVATNDIALVGFIDDNRDVKEYLRKLFSKLELKVGHTISFAIYNVKDDINIRISEDINYIPLIRLYFKGRSIFEQENYFGNLQTDYYVLRISVRDVLSQYGIKLVFKP